MSKPDSGTLNPKGKGKKKIEYCHFVREKMAMGKWFSDKIFIFC